MLPQPEISRAANEIVRTAGGIEVQSDRGVVDCLLPGVLPGADETAIEIGGRKLGIRGQGGGIVLLGLAPVALIHVGIAASQPGFGAVGAEPEDQREIGQGATRLAAQAVHLTARQVCGNRMRRELDGASARRDRAIVGAAAPPGLGLPQENSRFLAGCPGGG